MKDNKERREYLRLHQKGIREQRKAAGIIQVTVWVKIEHKQAVKDYAASLEKKGFKDED